MERTLPFDTLAYSKRLTEVGFTQKQAEVQAETLAEIIEQNSTTKRNLKELEFRLIIKLGTIMAASIAVIVALVKLV